MWCTKSTVVVVNFILDGLKETWLLVFLTTTLSFLLLMIPDVTKHLWQNPDLHIDFNNPTVLPHASNWRKLLIQETLLIQKKQPQLNIDKTFAPLCLFST